MIIVKITKNDDGNTIIIVIIIIVIIPIVIVNSLFQPGDFSPRSTADANVQFDII